MARYATALAVTSTGAPTNTRAAIHSGPSSSTLGASRCQWLSSLSAKTVRGVGSVASTTEAAAS